MKRNRKKLRMSFKRMIHSSLLALVVASSVLISGIPGSMAQKENNEVKTLTTSTGTVNYTKTAEDIGNDQYKISFNLESTLNESVINKADIVLLIDTSGSMGPGDRYHNYGNKIENIRNSAKAFCDTLLGTNSDVEIGIVTYDSSATNKLPLTQLNNDSQIDIKGVISNIGTYGATNTAKGIEFAGDMLNSGRVDAAKYLVFFTDGYPTMSEQTNTDRWRNRYYGDTRLPATGSTACDVFFKDAQKMYNRYFGGISAIGGLGYDIQMGYEDWLGGWHKTDYWVAQNKLGPVENITPNPNAPLANAKVYSIGCLTSVSDTDDLKEIESGPKFLYTLQNVEANYDLYKSKYFTENQTDINKIYGSIANEIKSQLITSSADNVVIKDFMTDEFIVPDPIEYESSKESVNVERISDDEVRINAGNLGDETVTVSFKVNAKDPYYSEDGAKTNVEASLNYNDPSEPNNPKKVLFNEPDVDIKPKEGTITVNKVVSNPNNLNIGQNKDNFTVALTREGGQGTYNIRVADGETQSMKFFLKQTDTDVLPNMDYSLNYLNVGTYTVKEIVPMNYKLDTIIINGTPVNNGDSFIIDKDHPNIEISVGNSVVNDKFWWDKAEVNNKFPYKYVPFTINGSENTGK